MEVKVIGGQKMFAKPIANIFISDYYQQCTSFLILSNKESVILRIVIT